MVKTECSFPNVTKPISRSSVKLNPDFILLLLNLTARRMYQRKWHILRPQARLSHYRTLAHFESKFAMDEFAQSREDDDLFADEFEAFEEPSVTTSFTPATEHAVVEDEGKGKAEEDKTEEDKTAEGEGEIFEGEVDKMA